MKTLTQNPTTILKTLTLLAILFVGVIIIKDAIINGTTI